MWRYLCGGHYLWGVGKWGGGNRSFTPTNRGVKKVLTPRKGGSKKFLNLNTMSRILISIITNSKKEDSENAISNDLETQNVLLKTFYSKRSLLDANHGGASWEWGPLGLTSFLPPE